MTIIAPSAPSRMDPTALATLSSALPDLLAKGAVPRRHEIMAALEAAASGLMLSGVMTLDALQQIAVGLFRAKHRPTRPWLEASERFAESYGGRERADCLEWLQALGRL